MNKLLLGGAAAAAIFATAPAVGQPAPPVAPAPAPQVHVMHAPMKAQTRDGVVSHVRDLFARLDTNRDGALTREEADAGHKQMAGDRRERFAQRLAHRGPDGGADRGAAFDRIDTNKDGQISRQEFDAGRQLREQRVFVMRDKRADAAPGVPGAPGAQREWRMHRKGGGMGALHGRMFETADANRDGRLTLKEATDAALRHFDTADVNHDGKLTPDERKQVRERIRIQRRPA
jgi:Ca2+-binding EF-hand superfamily protein